MAYGSPDTCPKTHMSDSLQPARILVVDDNEDVLQAARLLLKQELPQVERARRTCAAVSVQPWHVGLAHRQQAAAAYAGALVTLLQTVASQGRGAFAGDPTLLDLRAAAGIDDH